MWILWVLHYFGNEHVSSKQNWAKILNYGEHLPMTVTITTALTNRYMIMCLRVIGLRNAYTPIVLLYIKICLLHVEFWTKNKTLIIAFITYEALFLLINVLNCESNLNFASI